MKAIAIGASTSSSSINRQLANYVANLVPQAEVTELDLNAFLMPMYSSDEEETNGIPQAAGRFLEQIAAHDLVVISLAEHNGSYSAAFKNIYDWASRSEQKVWQGKKMLLLSTSPGARGGATVLDAAVNTFPRMGAELLGSYSLPKFYEHFVEGTVIEGEHREALKVLVNKSQ